MLEKVSWYKLQPKPKTTDEVKIALQTIWEELPREHVNKAVANFTKCLTAYMAVQAASGGHSKHAVTSYHTGKVPTINSSRSLRRLIR